MNCSNITTQLTNTAPFSVASFTLDGFHEIIKIAHPRTQITVQISRVEVTI